MSYEEENFDDLFNSNSNHSSLTTADVERISTNTFMRGVQALQQGAAVVQQMTSEAVRKTEEAHPGFITRYRDPEICRKFIEQRPAVARAILNAESGQGTDSLPELYDIFDETTRSWEQPANRGTEPPTGSSSPASILSLQQINRLPFPERHQVIQDLGDRVGDVSIDAADPGNEVFRIERGEQ